MTGTAGQQDKGTEGLTVEERSKLTGPTPDLLARRFAGDSRSYWRIVSDDFRRNRTAVVALWVMAAMALVAIFAPVLANHRPWIMIDQQGVQLQRYPKRLSSKVKRQLN